MVNCRLGILMLLLVSLRVEAQELWLEPQQFDFKPGDIAMVGIMQGEGIPGDAVDLTKIKIHKLQLQSLSATKDLKISPRIPIPLSEAGTFVVACESDPIEKEWSGADFQTYLEDNGLEDVINERSQALLSDQRATEVTVWSAKLILQSGNKQEDTFRKKSDTGIEIISDKNPSLLKTGDHVRCQILFNGKPAAHTMVKVWSQLNRTTFLQNIYTENDGTFVFPISVKGTWMISTMNMIPGENPGSEWKSYRGSLIFGIR